MILYEKDGITVQATSPQEEAEYKRLGFKQVKEVPEEIIAEKKSKKTDEDGK
jgi:hypothetical protein